MKPALIRKAMGAAATVLGLGWILMVLTLLFERSFYHGPMSDLFFTLPAIALATIPGFVMLAHGIGLFQSMRVDSLKWVIGVFAACGALWVCSTVRHAHPGFLPDRLAYSATIFAGSLLAVFVYLGILRLLLPRLDIGEDHAPVSIGRGALILLAWTFWMLLSDLFNAYAPIKEGYTHVPKEPWGTLGFFVPVLVAYGSYRLAASLLLPRKARQTQPDKQQAAGA